MSNIYFEIQANDMERAATFYRELFGWAFTRVEGLPIAYWHIDADGTNGGLLQRPATAPPQNCGTNAFCCSFEVADFDAMAAKALAKGGMVAMPKFAVPGKCWQGYFLDTEGNVFGLFEVDEDAR